MVKPEDHAGVAAAEAFAPLARTVAVSLGGQVNALNAGRTAARGDIVAFTDDDAVPSPDWLQRISERFDSDPRIGAVGGRDVVHHGARIDDGSVTKVGRALWWGRRIGGHHLRAPAQDVDFLKGVNMSYRCEALQPFDARLRGIGAQVACDLEASWSVRRRGWRVVYDPAVIVDHHPAERHDDDRRSGRSLQAVLNAEHNEVYALIRHAGRIHACVILAFQLLVGSRNAPGLLHALRASSRRHPQLEGHTLALAGARLSAVRTLRTGSAA